VKASQDRIERFEFNLAEMVRAKGLKGILVVMLHPGDRAEVASAMAEETPDLAGLLHRLADSIADGDGYPLGGHGETL